VLAGIFFACSLAIKLQAIKKRPKALLAQHEA